jgi:hypothetical protein
MNAVTPGVTDQFHGALYEFVRNSDLNGANFFAYSEDGLSAIQTRAQSAVRYRRT